MLTRHSFDKVFRENTDGSLSPKLPIIVNGITFGQTVAFGPGVTFGGVDVHKYKGKAILGEEKNGTLIIRGFFNN